MLLAEENKPGSPLVTEQSQHDPLDPFYAQFRDQSRFWIQRVAVPMIMVVGLFGNLITVIIMTRRRMRSTTNMYLAALALVDMLYLVLTFLLGLSHYPNMAGKKYYLYWRLRPFLMMLTDACSNTSVWLTVTFTIERFIAVKYPMKGKVWCTEARAKRLIVFVFFFGIMFASPVPFEWKVVEISSRTEQTKQLASINVSDFSSESQSDKNSFTKSQSFYGDKFDDDISRYISNKDEVQKQYQSSQQRPKADEIAYILTLENSDFGRNETYKTIYYWSTAVIFYFIPLLSLTFFNGFLILSVHRSLRERNRMTTGQQSGGACGGGARNQINCQNQSRETSTKMDQLQERDRRLVIPRIAIESKELGVAFDRSCVAENGRIELRTNGRGDSCQAATTREKGEKVVQHHERVVLNSESDCCQPKLISRSELVISSTDKMTTPQSELDSPVVDQHEITQTSSGAMSSENSSRVYVPERRVEFSCDSNKDDDESLNVQKNCDNANTDLNETGANRPNCNGQSRGKFAIAVPSPNANQIHENFTVKTLSSASVVRSAGQPVVSADDDVIRKNRLDQNSKLDSGADNKCVSTLISGPLADVGNSVSMSESGTGNAALADDKTVVINICKQANSKTCHHLDNALSNISHVGEKFQLKNATASGGGLSQYNNYDSGSCTTIQTATSLVPISTQERRITIMLIAVVILFLCCQIPSAAMLLYTSVREPAPNTNEHALVLAFGNIFNFLMAVNAAGNFILYSFLSKKYRRTFMILFCNCFQRKNSDSEERSRTTRYYSSQYSSSHGTLQTGRSINKNHSKSSIRPLKRWSNAGFLRSKLGLARQLTLKSDDLGNHLVKDFKLCTTNLSGCSGTRNNKRTTVVNGGKQRSVAAGAEC